MGNWPKSRRRWTGLSMCVHASIAVQQTPTNWIAMENKHIIYRWFFHSFADCVPLSICQPAGADRTALRWINVKFISLQYTYRRTHTHHDLYRHIFVWIFDFISNVPLWVEIIKENKTKIRFYLYTVSSVNSFTDHIECERQATTLIPISSTTRKEQQLPCSPFTTTQHEYTSIHSTNVVCGSIHRMCFNTLQISYQKHIICCSRVLIREESSMRVCSLSPHAIAVTTQRSK